jgi:nucleotide-binding universal stress UspA family protein
MKILVPVDGSKHSTAALKVAQDYGITKSAEIYLITVVQPIENIGAELLPALQSALKESIEQRAEQIVHQACDFLSIEGIKSHCKVVIFDISVADAIIDFAKKENIDLIIIGSRGLDPSVTFKIGSVAAKVIKHAPCSVYVVKI